METLWNLYQQRLNTLNTQFILLLSQFQNNQLLTTPQLAKYRIEYLGSMLEKTLKNHQEKLILKLYHEIDQLKHSNLQLIQQIVQINKSFDHSNDGIQLEFKDKSLGSTKVSTVCYKRDKDESDLFLESSSSKFGKRNQMKASNTNGKGKQRQLSRNLHNKNIKKHQNKANEQEQDEEMEMMRMNFKYLKL